MRFKKKIKNQNNYMYIERDFFIFKKLLHVLIKKGKKGKAQYYFQKLLVDLKFKNNNITIFDFITKSIENMKPLLDAQKIKKSNKVFYLPKMITEEQKTNLAIKWILKSVNTRKEKKLDERLEKEFLDCFFSKGSTLTKKQSLYNVILVNRPFLNLLMYK